MARLRGRWSATGPERAPARWAVVVPALALVLAVPVAAWWLVGDLSTVPASMGPDYAFRPWPISPAAARAAGIGSLAVGGIAVAALGWAAVQRRLDARWWAVLVPLLAAGFIKGQERLTAGQLMHPAHNHRSLPAIGTTVTRGAARSAADSDVDWANHSAYLCELPGSPLTRPRWRGAASRAHRADLGEGPRPQLRLVNRGRIVILHVGLEELCDEDQQHGGRDWVQKIVFARSAVSIRQPMVSGADRS